MDQWDHEAGMARVSGRNIGVRPQPILVEARVQSEYQAALRQELAAFDGKLILGQREQRELAAAIFRARMQASAATHRLFPGSLD